MSNGTPGFHPLGDAELAEETLSGTADIDPRLTRSQYFDGRLLTARDLTRDQIYLDQRVREIGQALGYGVESGLALTFETDPVDRPTSLFYRRQIRQHRHARGAIHRHGSRIAAVLYPDQVRIGRGAGCSGFPFPRP